MIPTLQPHSTKKDTFKVSSLFSIGILLFSLNCVYIYKLFQGIPYLCSTKVATCLSLNCVSFILALIACRFFSKQHFFLIEDKFALFLTFFTLVANFQLFWEPLLFDLPSSYLAGSALLYLHGLIPMLFYSSNVFQALHWVLATVYSVYIHFSTQSFAPELMICYSLSFIFFLYCLQKHHSSSQPSYEETKLTSNLISTLIPLFFDSSDELYFILNKDLETIAVSQAFSKEFNINNNRPTKILDILGQFKHASCTSQLFKILHHDQPHDITESSNCHRESTAATPTTWTSSLKRLTSDDIEDFSLRRISGLLFTHSQALKTNGFGWNTTTHKPKMHETAVSFRSKTIQVQFSYLEENDQDFILFRLGSKSHLTVTEKSANFSATDVATIIHELRTPLNGTIFLLQQAMEHSRVADDVKQEMLEPSLESAKRLHFLINDMLDFAQILEGKFRVIFESFNLEKALGHPVKLISALAKTKGVIVDLIIDRNVPTKIISDQNRLMQVIYNLLGNAVKFTTKGSIILSISPSRTKRNAIEFSVKDTGYGIKAEDLGKLFHAFEKIDNWHDNKVGTGLGLCISNAIVKGLGGTGLSVKSEPEKGSTFSFTIEDRALEQEIDYHKVSMSPKNSCFSAAYLSGRSLQSSSEEFPGAKLSLREMVLKGQVKKGTFRTRSMLTCLDSSEIMPEPRNKEIRTVHFDFNNHTQFSSPGSGFVRSSTSVRHSLDELESPEKAASISPKRDRRTTCPIVPSICLTTSCQCPQVIAVDDEPMNLTMLKIICNKLSFELKCFNGGQEAIDHFKRSANCERCDKCDGPALILMDCNMPVKDGFETASELMTLMRTQRMKKIPIYACTAEESFSLKNKILQCGMAGSILKPVLKEQLQNLVNESYKKGC